MKQFVLLLAMAFIAGAMFGKTIQLKDGSSISGKIVSRSDKAVVIEDERGIAHTFSTADLKEDLAPVSAVKGETVQNVETAQNVDISREAELKAKVLSATKFRNAGYLMLGGGGAMGLAGVIMVVASGGYTYYEYDSRYGERGSLLGGVGAIMTVAGVAVGVTGLVFAIIGSKRIDGYNEELKQNKDALQFQMNLNSIGFSYSF